MHHAFDEWMRLQHPQILFERYADDVLVHCATEQQASFMRDAIEKRLAQCKLELHPDKTQTVYCKDDDRRKKYPKENFDFLGYAFRARGAKNKYGNYFTSFLPAVSNKAKNKIRKAIRYWHIHRLTGATLQDIADKINPIVRGWYNYYGRFYKSEMYSVLRNVERCLVRWVQRKYKKLKDHTRNARRFLIGIRQRTPRLFVHWEIGLEING